MFSFRFSVFSYCPSPPVLFTIGLVLLLFVLAGCRDAGISSPDTSSTTAASHKKVPTRIISTVPSVTEVLFELGLGDRIVGVSRYCNYPEEATKLAKVGGLHDPNLERMLALEPDLIVMLDGAGDQIENYKELELPVLTVDHRSIEGVIESFKTIGTRCGVPKKGEQLAKELRDRLDRLRKKTAKLDAPRTLICVERTMGAGRLEDLCVAGRNPFFNEAISAAGGKNVMADSPIAFPMISIEGIIQTDPEVILDLAPTTLKSSEERKKSMEDWQSVDVKAIRNGRLYLLADDYALIPGPRFILLLEKLAELLHQEKRGSP